MLLGRATARLLQRRSSLAAAAAAATVAAAGSATGTPASSSAEGPPAAPKPEESLRFFRPTLKLEDASMIIDTALELRKLRDVLPLAVCVLDAGGNIVAIKREDGCSIMRVDVAMAKAYGALSMGSEYTRNLQLFVINIAFSDRLLVVNSAHEPDAGTVQNPPKLPDGPDRHRQSVRQRLGCRPRCSFPTLNRSFLPVLPCISKH